MKPLRLFVACDLPDDTLSAVTAWQRRALADRQDVRSNHAVHLTLVFLGDTDPDGVQRLVDALRGVAWRPCQAGIEGPLFLPKKGARHVVALALADPGGALRELQGRVSVALAATGLYEPEKRPWLPHVTVGRFRRPGPSFPLQNVTIPGFCVVRMALYSSSLESTGAVHTPLAVFPASCAREELHSG
jgi:2'-5' RNA ligase